MSQTQALDPDRDSLLYLATLRQDLPFPYPVRTRLRDTYFVAQVSRPQSINGSIEQNQDQTKPYDPNKPTHITTLPYEIRQEIYALLALTSSFEFLRDCRSINTQATPLLYKYGIYHIHAICSRHRHRIPVPPSSTLVKIQNLYISMPEISLAGEIPQDHDMFARTARLLRRFGGGTFHRMFCHLDLQVWHLSERMASVLRTFVGFERIKITARLRRFDEGNGERIRPYDREVKEEGREDYIKAMDEELGPWLGPAYCTKIVDENALEGSGNVFESMLFMDFYPM